MARKGSYQVRARILEVFANGTALAAFANGHTFLAHGGKNSPVAIKDLLPGDDIVVEVTTYDLSKGSVIARFGRAT